MARERVLVWDLPTRVFHWLLAASFAGAYFTGDSERWRDTHVMLGLTAAALIAFRLAWGFLGTPYARFSGFTFSPLLVIRYFRSLTTRTPEHYVGHNPAGSWAVLGLLTLVSLAVASGWAVLSATGHSESLEDLHESACNLALALVVVHVAAVAVSSRLHRENLVRAMLTGRKLAPRGTVPAAVRWPVALALAGAVATLWSGRVPLPGIEAHPSASQAAQHVLHTIDNDN
jgi:cytochrome b